MFRKKKSILYILLLTAILFASYFSAEIKALKKLLADGEFVHRIWNSLSMSELEIRRLQWGRVVELSANETRNKRLPDIIGIGVKKCGTDAVISFLQQHPLIKVPAKVESFFFNKAYGKGLDYYKSSMPSASKHELIMEKTPVYFTSPIIDLPARIKKDLPNAKLILVLCDPVKRSYSDYTHERARYAISKHNNVVAKYETFASYLDAYLEKVRKWKSAGIAELYNTLMPHFRSDEASTILTNGFYSIFLPRWTALFDSNQLLVLNGEDLINDPGSTIEEMQDFLGIPKLLLKGDFVRHPQTNFFCMRPWWKPAYNFTAEKLKLPRWEKDIVCLSSTKGRTRLKKNGFNYESYGYKLRDLYYSTNEDLNRTIGINYNS